ncbi:glucokinase [Pseudoalteromonas phenolica]|uniref:glucokinase n=1 Tax=Pseudoalteromonas phenolica TaxID=161398 RepID=UPI00384AF489
MEHLQSIRLVADIGGTNIRIAQATKDNQLSHVSTYKCADFAELSDVLKLYIAEQEIAGKSLHACLAIACPTDEDWISMTNLPWAFSQTALKAELGLQSLYLINDYKAIAMSVPFLNDEQKCHIRGPQEGRANSTISICGPGTGLGVATLTPVTLHSNHFWHCINSEGGHIDFAPVDELDLIIFNYLDGRKPRISYEQLLSGYGLEQIYSAIIDYQNAIEGRHTTVQKTTLSAAEISHNAISGSCTLSRLALQQFCKVLGSFAGNLALLNSSFGGVYIAGGIVPRFIEFLKQGDFGERFIAKGRLSHIAEQTPVFVITEPQPGLLGAAVFLNQEIN